MRVAIPLALVILTACGGGSSSSGPQTLEPSETALARLVEGSNSTRAILPLDDGSTIVAGVIPDPQGGARFADPDGTSVEFHGESFLLCYDADGTLLWHRTFGEEPRWLDLKAAPDGTILALGATESPNGVDVGPFHISDGAFGVTYFLARLDRSGTYLSADAIVETATQNLGGKLAVGTDGSIAVLIRKGAPLSVLPDYHEFPGGDWALIRWDGSGERLWIYTTTADGNEALEMLRNGDVVADFQTNVDTLFLRFDVDGTKFVDLEGRFDVRAIAACRDGYLISSDYNGGARLSIDPGEKVLLRIRGDGERDWLRAFEDGTTFTGLACKDGTILAAGSIKSSEGVTGLLLAFDDDGHDLWRLEVPSTSWINLSAVWFLPGGDIAISGQATSPATIEVPGRQLELGEPNDVLFHLTVR